MKGILRIDEERTTFHPCDKIDGQEMRTLIGDWWDTTTTPDRYVIVVDDCGLLKQLRPTLKWGQVFVGPALIVKMGVVKGEPDFVPIDRNEAELIMTSLKEQGAIASGQYQMETVESD